MRWDPAKLGNASQVTSAAIAIVAVIGAFLGYRAAVNEAKNKLSADAVFEWSRRQPANTSPCLRFMAKLETKDWILIIGRKELPVSSLKDEVLACFSDQDEKDIPTLLSNGNALTPKGAFVIASRLNAMLDADNFIAEFLLKGIGNPEMFKRIGDVICRDDGPILMRLPNDSRINDSFLAVRQYILSRSDCKSLLMSPPGLLRDPATFRDNLLS
jgi:hypothetical protein